MSALSRVLEKRKSPQISSYMWLVRKLNPGGFNLQGLPPALLLLAQWQLDID